MSKSPSEKLNVACIGVRGQGGANLGRISSFPDVNIVALCDVDTSRLVEALGDHQGARAYTDFRKLLDNSKDIDAVVVSTPDNTHAVIAMPTMQLGKHVYCEKPLTHDIWEARQMTEQARKYKVATQMGNHGHSSDGLREQVEWIRAGVIGPVKEVHVWTNRPIWPQGLERPKEEQKVPGNIKWDLWLGPAPERPYNDVYLPFKWRGWWDFGTGALGDMACHIMDPAYWALNLGQPVAIEATSEGGTLESPPKWSIIRYDFPARGELPACRMTWYDGNKLPDIVRDARKAAEDAAATQPTDDAKKATRGKKNPFEADGGLIFIGEKGTMLAPYQKSPLLLKSPSDFKPPAPTLPRGEANQDSPHRHHREFVNACKGGPAALSNFDYAGPLTETVLLGNLAVRTDKRVEWDASSMKSTNVPEANQYVKREYRKGWSLGV
ncbi:MAG TPA: Gfo/Idh/MocA family oxidoreductase [Tepidisphaeraceae bacterium]|nr:Gfo/Idh/MocA family oxidoreductase [Tepidisphaeraceae bacterium]